MWYPAKIIEAATVEPVSLVEAKAQCNVDFAEDDAKLSGMIAAARSHIEGYCNIALGRRTVELKCDGFEDMARLPVAPIHSVASLSYIDTAGAAQVLAPSVYELRADDLEASIARNFREAWPAIRPGSRITLIASVGYEAVPAAIKHALLLHVAESYLNRENAKGEAWTVIDSLLCNFRRGA